MRGRQVAALLLREPRLRWRVDPRLPATPCRPARRDVRRRAKYLIIDLDAGSLILHLGMSGSLRVLDPATPLDTARPLRPAARIGSLPALQRPAPLRQPALVGGRPCAIIRCWRALGPEPLTSALRRRLPRAPRTGPPGCGQAVPHGSARRRRRRQHLCERGAVSRGRAPEARGGPGRAARGSPRSSRRSARCSATRSGRAARRCVTTSAPTARRAISGSKLYVYERTGQPCRRCRTPVRHVVQGQRSTYYCPRCQR